MFPSIHPGPTEGVSDQEQAGLATSWCANSRRQDKGHGPEGVLKLAEEHSDSRLVLIPRGHTGSVDGSEDYCVEGVTRSTHALTKPLPGGVGGRGGPRAPGDTTDTQRILKDETQETKILKGEAQKILKGEAQERILKDEIQETKILKGEAQETTDEQRILKDATQETKILKGEAQERILKRTKIRRRRS